MLYSLPFLGSKRAERSEPLLTFLTQVRKVSRVGVLSMDGKKGGG